MERRLGRQGLVGRGWGATLIGAVLVSACGGAAQEPRQKENPQGFAVPEQSPVTAELIAEHASIQPGGATRIGVHFELERGWHIYAEEPGDAGLPTKVTWQGPAGTTFGPLVWPKPGRLLDPGDITTYGYTSDVVLFSSLEYSTPQGNASTLPLQAKVSWLACRDVCIPGRATLSLSLPVSASAPAMSMHARLFEHTSE